MQSTGKGVCKLLLAAGVVGLISGAHANAPDDIDGDALSPGDEVVQYDQAYAEPDQYGDEFTEEDGDEEADGEVEEVDAYGYADAPEDVDLGYLDGDGYGFTPEEVDAYATPPEEEDGEDPYADGPDDELFVDAYATPPEEDAYATAPEEDEDPYAVPPEEDEDAYATGPEELDAYGPSEEEIAGPEEVEGPVEVEGPEVAEGPSTDGTLSLEGFSANPGVDYIPEFDNAVISQNIGGNVVADQDECAALCAADDACNAASFYLDASAYGGSNCWTKTLSIPCEVPSDAPADPNAVLLLQTTDCEPVPLAEIPAPVPEEILEEPELAPMLAPDAGPIAAAPRDFIFGMAPGPAGGLAELSYFAYDKADYVPSDMPPNLVSVENTDMPGSLETDMVACAMRCDATPMCNAASYYADPSKYGDNNCWLKIIGDPCELPADAQSVAGATLLMKQDTCPALGAIAPGALEPSMVPVGIDMMPATAPTDMPGAAPEVATAVDGPAPAGVAPVTDGGIGLANAPTETIDGADNTAGPVDSDSTVADAASAVTVQSAAALVATVAAIALLG